MEKENKQSLQKIIFQGHILYLSLFTSTGHTSPPLSPVTRFQLRRYSPEQGPVLSSTALFWVSNLLSVQQVSRRGPAMQLQSKQSPVDWGLWWTMPWTSFFLLPPRNFAKTYLICTCEHIFCEHCLLPLYDFQIVSLLYSIIHRE